MMKLRVADVKEILKERTEAELLERLCPGHRRELEQIKAAQVKASSIAAELLLQEMLLEENMGILGESGQWTWQRGEQGKPWIPELLPWHFNLSHSGELVACALSKNPVGIDLQVITAPREALVNRYFLPWEQELVQQADDPAGVFTLLWCAREAVGKWKGSGLGYPGRKHEYRWVKNGEAVWNVLVDEFPVCKLLALRSGNSIVAVCSEGEEVVSCSIPEGYDKIIIQ